MPNEEVGSANARLQALRGLAALIVLVHHSLRTVSGGSITWFVSERILNAHAAVVIFFVLSGYVLALSLQRRGLGLWAVAGFYLRRAFRIYPALFVGVALGSLYVVSWPLWPSAELSTWASSILKPGQFTPINLISSLSGLGTTLLPPLWTINVELVASVILPLLTLLAMRGPKTAWGGVFVLAAVSFLARSAVPIYLVHFAIGAAMVTSPFTKRIAHPGWVALLSAVVLLGFRNFGEWGYHDPLPSLVEGLAGAILIAAIVNGAARILESKILTAVGDWSYGVYLFHLPIAFAFARWVSTIQMGGEFKALLVASLTLLVTLPLSWLVYEKIEQPGIDAGRRLATALAKVGSSWQSKLRPLHTGRARVD